MPIICNRTKRGISTYLFAMAAGLATSSMAYADDMSRADLMALAPATCLSAAAEHYRVERDEVALNERRQARYKSSLGGVAVPIKVKLNGRTRDRICLAEPDGSFRFLANGV